VSYISVVVKLGTLHMVGFKAFFAEQCVQQWEHVFWILKRLMHTSGRVT